MDNGLETSGFEKISADIVSGELLALAAPFTGAGAATTVTMPRVPYFRAHAALCVAWAVRPLDALPVGR